MSELPVLLAAAALGGALLLDNNVVFQGLLSRPLVTGAIFGWLLDDMLHPLLMGAMLELLWANVIPLGESQRPSSTVLGVLCAIVIARWPGGWEGEQPYAIVAGLFLVVLFCIPVSYLAKYWTLRLRRTIVSLNGECAAAVARGEFSRLFWLNLRPLPRYWALHTVILAVFAPLYLWLLPHIYVALDESSCHGLAFAGLTMPFLGLAVFTNLFDGLSLKRWLLAGAALALAQRLLVPHLPPLAALVVLLAGGLVYITARRLLVAHG